jgi:membrane protease YdiL (CAAX protease family)
MVITSGEEIGWRGFALPLMLEKWTNIYGVSIVLGVIWGLWHLPLYLVPAQSSFPYPLFVIFTVAASVIYTVLFIKTKGSALPVVMLHAGTDVGARIFQIAYFTPTVWLTMDVLLLLVAVGMSLGRQSANKAVDII